MTSCKVSPIIPYVINVCTPGYKYPVLKTIKGFAKTKEEIKDIIIEEFGELFDDYKDEHESKLPNIKTLFDAYEEIYWKSCYCMAENNIIEYFILEDGEWVENPCGEPEEIFLEYWN